MREERFAAQSQEQADWLRQMRGVLPDNICDPNLDAARSYETLDEAADVPEAIDTKTEIIARPSGYLQTCGHPLWSPASGMPNPALHALPHNFRPNQNMVRTGVHVKFGGMEFDLPRGRSALAFYFNSLHPVTPLIQGYELVTQTKTVGVVYGNAPTIDDLPKSHFRLVERKAFATAGVNRCCISKAFERADFAPTINVIQDGRGNFRSAAPAMIEGLRRWSNRTWRICCRAVWPNDQTFFKLQMTQPSIGLLGAGIGGVHNHHSTPLAAIEFLYRMGLRTFYIYGVELRGPHFKMGPKDDVAGLQGDEEGTWLMWRLAMRNFGDAEFFCGSKTSLLVEKGIMPYGAL